MQNDAWSGQRPTLQGIMIKASETVSPEGKANTREKSCNPAKWGGVVKGLNPETGSIKRRTQNEEAFPTWEKKNARRWRKREGQCKNE